MTESWGDTERDAARRRVQALMDGFAGVLAEEANGHVGYLVRRARLAWLLADHSGDDRLALCVKAPPGVQQVLVANGEGRYFVPSYLGARGWVGADLSAAADWDQIADLVEQAWRMSAPRKLVRELDAAGRTASS